MTTGSVAKGDGVPTVTTDGEDLRARDGSKHLRDIEELVAKLRIVTKQLAFPPRATPAPRCSEEFARAQLAAHGEAAEPRGEQNYQDRSGGA